MTDRYGYIGIETLLNFCSNQKDHCVTPNDFMRMNRVKIDERPHGEWIPKAVHNCWTRFECSVCGYYHQPVHDFGESKPDYNFCPNCGALMVKKEGDANENDGRRISSANDE